MTSKIAKFNAFRDHPIIGKSYKKLTVDERNLCIQFMIENDHLEKNEYFIKVNRWFLDDPNKPSNHTDMWALVMQSYC